MAAELTERRRKTAFDAIVRECARDLPPDELLIRVAERLRHAVAYDSGGWMLLDPQTMMFTGGVRPDRPPQVLSRLLANEFAADDVIKFGALARSPSPAATLWQATGGRPERSPRYSRIIAPLGGGDELRAVFRAGGACWGGVSLVRGAAEARFSQPETAFVAAAGRHIADALRRSLMARAPAPAGGQAPAGVLVLAGDDTVESQTPEAVRLLRQGGQSGNERLPLPMAVFSVAHQARAIASGRVGAARATARVRLASGRWLAVEAAPLDDPRDAPPGEPGDEPPDEPGDEPRDDAHRASGRVAVVLRPASPAQLAPLVLAASGLTARERQIAAMLLRGAATGHIARSLVISRNTLRDHIKAIYAKLGVTSRPEFTALLAGEEETAGDARRPDAASGR